LPGRAARARVLIVEDAQATKAFVPQPARIRRLVEQGITNLTGLASVEAAWRSLVSTQEVVGIKVYSSPGPSIGTRPAVVEALAQGLLQAGLPSGNLVVWDKHQADLERAGFGHLCRRLGIRLAGAAERGWDPEVSYDVPLLGRLVYGDLEFRKEGENVSRKSHLSRLLTKELTRIINVSPLLNHNSAGVCGSLYSLAMGSADNVLRFEGQPARLAQAVPEICAMPAVGDRVVLNVVDALIAQYQGESVGRLHYSSPLNQLRFGVDPVALDVLSLEELELQRQFNDISSQSATNAMDLYRNAALLELGIADLHRIQVETLK